MKRDLKLQYQTNVHNFFTNHEAAYNAIVELGDTHNLAACKKIAEEHNLNAGTVQNIHYFIRTLKSNGVLVDPSQPVIKVQMRREEKYIKDLNGFKSNHAKCYNRLKEFMEKGQPMDKSTSRQLGKKYGLKPGSVYSTFYIMNRFAKKDEERQEDDGAQMEEDGDHEEQEEQEEQMDDGEFEDPDPNEPSTSGPPRRTRYEELEDAYSEEYQFEESKGQSSKQRIRRSREGNESPEHPSKASLLKIHHSLGSLDASESGRRQLRHDEADFPDSPGSGMLSEPSTSRRKRHTKRQGEGNDWLDLDPRTRSAGGTSEGRSRRAEKISVPRAASTKRHHSSGSPDAPEAKRRQMDETEQLEPRGHREQDTSPSPPPEHQNSQGDRGSVMVSRRMEERNVSEPKKDKKMNRLLQSSTEETGGCKSQENLNELKVYFKAIRRILSQMTSDDIEEMRTALEWELSTIRKTLKKGNGNNSLGSGEEKTVRMVKASVEQLEQEPTRRRETGSQTDPETWTITVVNSSQALGPEKAAYVHLIARGGETFGRQPDLQPEALEPESVVQLREQETVVVKKVRPEATEQHQEAQPDSNEITEHVLQEDTVEQLQQQEKTPEDRSEAEPDADKLEITDRTSSQVEPEEDVEPESDVQEAEVPEEQQQSPETQETTRNAPINDTCQSIDKEIRVALEILHNFLSQFEDEDVSDIGRSLRVDLKEMKRLLQSSTVPEKKSWKKEYCRSQERISEINICLTALGNYLSELPVEDRDTLCNDLKLDLSKVQMMVYNWNGNEDEAIKEEEIDVEVPMEQEQQDGTPEDQPEPQVKQEPEEEPVADPNC